MITNSLTLSNKTTASFTSNGRINSYGLTEAIKAIPPSVLSLSAANTLLRICADACASSDYRLFKSMDTMCEETFQSENTVRSHLKQIVKAGILSRREVFKEGRQMTNEYRFTREFLQAASQFRRAADTTARRARDLFKKLLSNFMRALLALTDTLFSDRKKAPQDLPPRGRKSCTQLSVSSDHEKEKNISEGEDQDGVSFLYRETPGTEAVEYQQVQRERSDTRLNDAVERQKADANIKSVVQQIITKAATKRAFGLMKSQPRAKATSAAKDTISSHNHAKYERANREAEERYQERAAIKDVQAKGMAHIAAIRQNLFKSKK